MPGGSAWAPALWICDGAMFDIIERVVIKNGNGATDVRKRRRGNRRRPARTAAADERRAAAFFPFTSANRCMHNFTIRICLSDRSIHPGPHDRHARHETPSAHTPATTRTPQIARSPILLQPPSTPLVSTPPRAQPPMAATPVPPPPLLLQGRVIRLSPALAPPLAAFLRTRLAALGADVGVGLFEEPGPGPGPSLSSSSASRFCACEHLPILVVPSADEKDGWVFCMLVVDSASFAVSDWLTD